MPTPISRWQTSAILEDLEGGVTSILLHFDAAAKQGLDADEATAGELAGRDGIMAYDVDDLAAVLAGVRLEMIGLAIDAGAAFLPAAAVLAATWQRQGVAPADARGAFNADPLAVRARYGGLPLESSAALAQLATLASWTAANYPHVTAVGVDTSPYHHAGATAVQDLAFAAATGVEYLRAMVDQGLDIDTAARQIVFRLSLGTHHFLAIAKLRAARWLWSRIVSACGGSSDAAAMQIHARTSNRVLTQRDPYVNMLRNTVAVFAAGVAGADAITSVPFDAMSGLPDAASRRAARNTGLVLQEEAHLNRVLDPAGGSWFLDRLTAQLAEQAWEIFQEIDRQGGMLAAIDNRWIAGQIDAAFAPRAKDIARRKQGITGVSEFPNVDEEPIRHAPPDIGVLRRGARERIRQRRVDTAALEGLSLTSSGEPMTAAVEAATQGATIGQLAAALGFSQDEIGLLPPIEPRSFAEPFEALREASDAWLEQHGSRPRIFLANLGPVAHHTARANYAKNFFEAGGFEVIGNEGFADAAAAADAFRQSHAGVAVICSSDKLYPEFIPQVAPQLKAAGARSVIVAGYPGEHEQTYRQAGVDRFIYIKCDVLATLRDLLRDEGVLPPADSGEPN